MEEEKSGDVAETANDGGMDARRIARIGMIAATYAAGTLVTILFLGGLAWGPVQFRISEAITVLALFTSDAIPGLALGCVIANAANIVLGGTGTLGLLDVVFGTLATALGAAFTWHFRKRVGLALLGPVIANALIVPAYLPLMLAGLGFYTIPFTSISLEGSYPLMYLFGLVATGVGEGLVLYVLGMPLARSLAKSSVARQLGSAQEGERADEKARA